MVKSEFIWFNGSFIKWDEAKIHLLTHSLHYGSAVFEGIRFYETEEGPAVFRLEDHLKRLLFSAKSIGMKVLWNKDQIEKAVLDLVKRNKLKSGYIRPIIFYGDKMGLNPDGADINLAIACWNWGKYLEKDVVRVKISSFERIHPKTSIMEAKISGHYCNSILATLEAKKAGFDEALFLDFKGNIAEGPGENIFFVKNEKIFTPPKGAILPGITRDTVLKLAVDFGFSVVEKNIKPRDCQKFNEAFFTGTAAEIAAIGRIDDMRIGNGKEGKMTKQIKEAYGKLVRGQLGKYRKWLSYVGV